ncbi:MAG TPA: hypothetical protein VL244_06285 [Alphaproteobacteria bacterium]|nr:hypothetical protein [Alphaproteobacteria bacterium]
MSENRFTQPEALSTSLRRPPPAAAGRRREDAAEHLRLRRCSIGAQDISVFLERLDPETAEIDVEGAALGIDRTGVRGGHGIDDGDLLLWPS